MRICILIPAYNESGTIGALVRALKTRGLDVVVVNDGSTDETGSIAEKNGALVLTNDKQSGKGVSLQRGFSNIIKNGFNGIITMDGDGQHDAEDIDKFLDLVKENKNCIISGNRMADSKGMPFVRFFTNKVMSGLISLACRQKVPDTQCGYRYIGSSVLKAITLKSGDFEIETEILMKSAKKGFKIYSVPIKTIYRNEKSQINPFKDTVRFIIYFSKELFSF